MKKYTLILLIIGLFSFAANAQKIKKPTLDSVPPTPSQQKILQEGIKLHDSKDFAGAIALYQQVLRENPDCTLAIYELALSYYGKKDFDNTLETAYRLVQYKGKTGILVYGLFANVLDDQGKPNDAIKIYKSAIKQLKGDTEYGRHLSSLYYNLGVTYARQKKYKEARTELKKSIQTDFLYPTPNYVLAQLYIGSKYKVPAFLAASRLVTLEFNSQRAVRSAKIVKDVLKPASKDAKGNINIFLNFDAPKDEGDFSGIELFLGTLMIVKDEKDVKKSKNEVFADAVGTLIALLDEDKRLKSTFVGKTYIPFMSAMKKKGYVKHFAYLVLQQAGDENAKRWLVDEGQKTIDFVNWARAYRLK